MAKAILLVFLLAVILVCSAVRVHVASCNHLCSSSPSSLAERDECCRDNGYLGTAGCPAEPSASADIGLRKSASASASADIVKTCISNNPGLDGAIMRGVRGETRVGGAPAAFAVLSGLGQVF